MATLHVRMFPALEKGVFDVCFSPPRSAVHRGRAERRSSGSWLTYSSVDGYACRDATWHGRIARRVSQPAMGKLTNIRVSKEGGGNGSCPCAIRITSIGGEAPQASTAKFKVVAVMSGSFAYRSNSASLVQIRCPWVPALQLASDDEHVLRNNKNFSLRRPTL